MLRYQFIEFLEEIQIEFQKLISNKYIFYKEEMVLASHSLFLEFRQY
jgi:hypothetical protein